MSSTPTSKPIILYDILLHPPAEESCSAPNPWKAREAINFKKLPYKTSWVRFADIPKVRQSLKVPACRKLPDGSDFYTLPIIEDPATGTLVGESFDIAVYLQKTYPDAGAGDLFPAQKLDYVFGGEQASNFPPLSDCSDKEYPEYAKFNENVDALFTSHVQLSIENFSFDPETEESTKAEFVRHAGAKSWDDFKLDDEQREKLKASFRNGLGELARLFRRDTSGPFLLGSTASYADLIVGGWLRMMEVTLPESEWKELKTWHNGLFGQLYEALQVFAEVK